MVRRVSDRDATRTEGDDVKIQVLYFAGCPNHEPAVTRVREVAAELGIDAEGVEVGGTGAGWIKLVCGAGGRGRRWRGCAGACGWGGLQRMSGCLHCDHAAGL